MTLIKKAVKRQLIKLISQDQQVKDFADKVKQDYGHIDIIFNNVDNGAGRIHEYPVEVFDKIMSVDMRGTFLVTKFLLPLMLIMEVQSLIQLHSRDKQQTCIVLVIMPLKVASLISLNRLRLNMAVKIFVRTRLHQVPLKHRL